MPQAWELQFCASVSTDSMGEVAVQTELCFLAYTNPHVLPTFTYMGNNLVSGFGFKIVISSAPPTILLIYAAISSERYVQAVFTIAWAGCPRCLANGLQIKSHQKKHSSLPFHSSTSGKQILLHPVGNWGTERVCPWKFGNPAAPLILILLGHLAEKHLQKQNKLTSTKLMVR